MKGNFFLGSDYSTKFEIREMPEVTLGSNDVLVKVMSCGVCGTDVHIYHGGVGSAPVHPPVVLGHEFAGIVEQIGSNVNNVQVGDHVTLDPNMYCGKCRPCKMGIKSNCENLYALGVNTNGGFAEYCVSPSEQCYKLNDDVDFDVAAMAEPLACVIHGIDRANISVGQNVLIVGGGTIGLMMAQLAKLSGTATVILSEPNVQKHALAKQIGLDYVIDPIHEDIHAKIKEICGTDGTDVVIDCVGKVATCEQAFSLAGRGATVMFFGVPDVDAKMSLPLFDIYKKEIRLVGSIINPDTHQRAVEMINTGRLKLKELITHTYNLEHLEDAIHMQASAESVKVVVHPNN